MLYIDDVTLVLGTAVLLTALLSPFVNVLLFRIKPEHYGSTAPSPDAADSSEADLPTERRQRPGISVVITVDDEGESLKANLPKWLSQSYEGDYQVIVVVAGNDSLVENVLKQNSGSERLYTTFIPSSSRYMSRKKLAVTIGVKAAKYDWVLLTDADCSPCTDKYIDNVSGKCSGDCRLVLGYTNYGEGMPAARQFDSTYSLYRQLAMAGRGRAWAYSGKSLLFGKRMFIDGKGFDGNLKYARGEYEYIVNKFASDTNVSLSVDTGSMVTEEPLTDRGWTNKCLNYMAIRKTLKRSKLPRALFNMSMASMMVANLAAVGIAAYSLLAQKWILAGCSVFALILAGIIRTVLLNRSLRPYLEGMSLPHMWWLEQTLPLRNAIRMAKYRLADKYDFISHKI